MTEGQLLEMPDGKPFLMEDGHRFFLCFNFPDGNQFITVNEQDDAMWVSWKDSTLRQQVAYEDAAEDQPETAFTLPAQVTADDYYNYEFADPERWRCFKLTYPGVQGSFYGYAAADSEVLKQLEGPFQQALKAPVDLKVKFPPGKSGHKQVEILSLETDKADENPDSGNPHPEIEGGEKPTSDSVAAPIPEDTSRIHVVTTGTGLPGGQPELHNLGQDITVGFSTRLYHGPDTDTRAIVRWREWRSIRTARHARLQVASDTMGNHQRWAAFWEEGTGILWIAPGPYDNKEDAPWAGTELHRFDLRDPDNITEKIYSGIPAENAPSAALRAKIASTVTFPAAAEFQGRYRHWSVEGKNPPTYPAGQIFVFLRKDFRFQVGTQPECGPDGLTDCLKKEAAGRERPFEIVVHTLAGYPIQQEDAAISALQNLMASPLVRESKKSAPGPISPKPIAPITDGSSSALVVQPPGQDPIVILTNREFTTSADSSNESGSITMPVNTSDKTLTIAYTWSAAATGVFDLKAGGYSVSRFDLSRGRVFLVHFDKMEFAAQIFQVPEDVKVPVPFTPALLTVAAAQISAWYVSCDDRALWERTRVIVAEKERRNGIPLDAAAEKIIWSKPNEDGLRLGLGGLDGESAFPVGQTLPITQYIRNDGPVARDLSPTGIFNEGVDGKLIRTRDGRVFPHQKGYRWQMSFDRVRLTPGQYIELRIGPMRTIMAEPDGSSTGAMDMLGQGFTVLPGAYTLTITHGIGQFLGRPVNSQFGDPRNSPGLGEWTGVLTSASGPLRLRAPEIRTAKPGSSEVFGTKYTIDFDKGVLRLRHYHGYPNMSMTGHPWESKSRDWPTKSADGDYLIAWAVGGNGFWLKDKDGITHLLAGENLTESGHWPAGEIPAAADSMPDGVSEVFGLRPVAATPVFDFTKLPAAPGPAKIEGAFFEMTLPGLPAGSESPQSPVLKVPHGRSEFYVESDGKSYGPATGNPVIELGLTDLLREKLTETPNTDELQMLEHMTREGEGPIRDCAFRLLGELKTPRTPFDYDSLFHAMIQAQIEDEEGSEALSPEARTGRTWFWNLFHESRREWERTRPLLPDDHYKPGENSGQAEPIDWTPGPDGISIGVSGLSAGVVLETGKSLRLSIHLRNDSAAPFKLSVPTDHNPFLQINLTDSAGKHWPANYRFGTGVTGYRHYQLSPGQSITVARTELESHADATAAESTDHKEGQEHNPRLTAPPGKYQLSLSYRNSLLTLPTADPLSEWTGTLTAEPRDITLTAPAKVAK